METAKLTTSHLTPIYYIPQIAQQLRKYDVNINEWLERAGLEESELELTKYIKLAAYSTLFKDAINLTGQSGLGLLVGNTLHPTSHGVLGLAASATGSVLEALKLTETYISLRTTLIGIRLLIEGNIVHVVFEPNAELGAIGHVVSDMAVLAIKKFVDTKTEPDSICKGVTFTLSEPSHAKLARELLNCPVRYGHDRVSLIYHLEDVNSDYSQRDSLVIAEALEICDRRLEEVTSLQSISEKLKRLIYSKKEEFPSLTSVAHLLGMAPRTLHRRLREENTTYKEVLDSVRYHLAREYLDDRKLSVKETAYRLGYSDISNFRRAFKRWYGFPPSQL